MIKLFQKKTHAELEGLMAKTRSSMQNNYKDNAQSYFKEFCAKYEELMSSETLNDRQKEYYGLERDALSEELKGFTHKDQKPYWH